MCGPNCKSLVFRSVWHRSTRTCNMHSWKSCRMLQTLSETERQIEVFHARRQLLLFIIFIGTRYLVCIYRILVCFSGKTIIDACLFCELCQTRAPKNKERYERVEARDSWTNVSSVSFLIFFTWPTYAMQHVRSSGRTGRKKKTKTKRELCLNFQLATLRVHSVDFECLLSLRIALLHHHDVDKMHCF